MRITAYTYEAAMHCHWCTAARFRDLYGEQAPTRPGDEHGVPLDATDRDGNKVHPVFVTDEGWQEEHCDDCREKF